MKKNYFVTDHQYINTGGNCMVSIFSVYERQQNVTRYIIINEEGVTYQTADTISADLQDNWENDYDIFILLDFTWDALTEQRLSKYSIDKELIELMIECRFEYLKKDCEYFRTPVNVSYDELPKELMNTISPECTAWHIENEQYFTTNGYEVSPNEYYRPSETEQKRIVADAFHKWLKNIVNNPEAREKLYDHDITISLDDRTIKIPFHADTYSALDKLLEDALEEW